MEWTRSYVRFTKQMMLEMLFANASSVVSYTRGPKVLMRVSDGGGG